MSLTTHGSETTAYINFRLGEIARFLQWADENGLKVSIKLTGAADRVNDIIIKGCEKGIATWSIDRVAGSLFLCHMGDRTEQGPEVLNGAVASDNDELTRIIVDIEAHCHGARETDSRYTTNTGHTRGT